MITRVDTFSKVLHIHFYKVPVMPSADNHPPVLFGIADSITQQIGEHPSNLFAVDKQFRHFFFRILHFYLNTEFISLYLIGLDGILYQFNGLCYFRHHLQFTGFYLRHVQ